MDTIVIIPYRDRQEHLARFVPHMRCVLSEEGMTPLFVVAHQCDTQLFNRGAMKNIGFLEAMKINPDALFIIHDVDIVPVQAGSLNYRPAKDTIRHVIGLPGINLGGIISFDNKALFKRAGGFPNYFGWEPEDVTLRDRCDRKGVRIDEEGQRNHVDPSFCIMFSHPLADSSQNADLWELRERERVEGGDWSGSESGESEAANDGLGNLHYECDYDWKEEDLLFCNIKFKLLQR